MKANKVVKCCIILSLLVGAQSAFAGKEVGNGGAAFICPDPTQSVVLDLFEVTVPGLVPRMPPGGGTIVTSDLPIETQIQNAFARLNSGSPLYKAVLNVYGQVRGATQIPISSDEMIDWPADEHNPISRVGCTGKGIALFDDENNSIRLDARALASLPNTQQAALWVHETIYKFLRETQNDPDSIRARAIVGHLFSTESEESLDAAIKSIAGWDPHATYTFQTVSKLGKVPSFTGEIGTRIDSTAEVYPSVLSYSTSYPGEKISLKFWSDTKLDPSSDRGCTMPSSLFFLNNPKTEFKADTWDWWQSGRQPINPGSPVTVTVTAGTNDVFAIEPDLGTNVRYDESFADYDSQGGTGYNNGCWNSVNWGVDSSPCGFMPNWDAEQGALWWHHKLNCIIPTYVSDSAGHTAAMTPIVSNTVSYFLTKIEMSSDSTASQSDAQTQE